MFSWFKKSTAVGIDISDYSIEILQLNRNREVLFYNRMILEDNIVLDGRILNKEVLVERLRTVLVGAPDHFPRAVLSLPESKAFVHFFTVPLGIREHELEKEIYDRALKIIPLDQKILCWDYFVTQSKLEQRVLFVGTDKEILGEYLEVMRLADINLTVVEIESCALARALLGSPHDNTNSLIIDIGARTTNISIFDERNILQLSITVPVAGQHFTKAISEDLKISIQEAERLKKILGFDGAKKDNRIIEILDDKFADVIKEVNELISYYEGKRGGKIGEIIIAGGSALLPQIKEFVGLKVGRRVTIGDPFKKVRKYEQLEMQGGAILYTNVIGLAIRGISNLTKGINLLRGLDNKNFTASSYSKFGKLHDLLVRFKKRSQ